MKESDDAYWLLEALGSLRSPEVNLVRELLGHLRELKDEQTEEMLSGSEGIDSEPQRRAAFSLRLRKAIYSRIREGWSQVKSLPPCLQQCRLLKETSSFCARAYLITDPLDEAESPLSLEKAKEYGHEALEIAQQLGALGEKAEIYAALSAHYKLSAEYEKAMDYCISAIALAEQIGNLHLKQGAYALKDELLGLTGAGTPELIENQRNMLRCAFLFGDIRSIFYSGCALAKLLVLSGNLKEGEEELEKIHEVMAKNSENLEEGPTLAAYHSYNIKSLLRYKQGDIPEAVESQKKATLLNIGSPYYREDYLWPDLAWLEKLCKESGDCFRAFCDGLEGNTRLQQWYLIEGKPEDIAWDEEEHFDKGSLLSQWHWVDPLQKGFYRLENGLEIAPVMGAGFYSNVYAPRMMREVEGDFVIETIMDYSNGFTKAGGILAYQDDNTLLRFGAGIQFDGEITLTVKSPEHGFFIIARGLLEAENLYLRLERNGDCFRAWCGDGSDWYKCGQVEVKMNEKIEAGLFAECTYRNFELVRCKTEKVRLGVLRVAQNPQG